MATPAIAPLPSKLTASSTSVTITDATVGAVIYYTTDGSTPTTASTKYSAAFQLNCPVNTTVTVKAYAPALNSTYTDSSTSVTTYTCQTQAAMPVISPVSGNIGAGSNVTMTDATTGTSIYYTVDGTTPTVNSIKYTGSFTINASQTIKAVAVSSDATCVNSAIAVVTYTVVQNPTIQVGAISVPVGLNTGSVLIPMSTTNCDHLDYTITPAFPAPTSIGGVLGSVTYLPSNKCQAVFSPGSTMPAPTHAMYQYTITFTAYGVAGSTSASASTIVSLTTPPIVMGSTNLTLPAGSGSATENFEGANCGFTSYNGLSSGDLWTGTLNGDGTPADAINGIPTRFADCNHVSMDTIYSGANPGDDIYTYLYNPPPAGGMSAQIIITWVATSGSSAVLTSADGTIATLKSQSTVNYLKPDGSIAKTVTSAPGIMTFGSQSVPAGDIHQLITCGSASANFCALGKNQLTVFATNGIAINRYTLPEDVRFAVANNDSSIYVFSMTNHLYSLANGSVSLLDGFTSSQDVTAAAINGNELAAMTSDGQLQRFNVDANANIGTYQIPTEMNNIAYTRDGSILIGKLGSASISSLDRSGTLHSLTLAAELKTLVQQDQDDPLASLATGDIIKVDSLGDSTKMATAQPEDLNAGFRIQGRTLVLTHVDSQTNARQVKTLATVQ